MRIAFTHNLRLTDSEEEAEFDSAETVEAIAEGVDQVARQACGGRLCALDLVGVAERRDGAAPEIHRAGTAGDAQ